jgi:hypothetical protein
MITVFMSPNRLVRDVVQFIDSMKRKGYKLLDTCWDLEVGFEMTFQRRH